MKKNYQLRDTDKVISEACYNKLPTKLHHNFDTTEDNVTHCVGEGGMEDLEGEEDPNIQNLLTPLPAEEEMGEDATEGAMEENTQAAEQK